MGISAVQIPLWAILMTLYYLFKRKISQVIKPDSKWGPGDKAVRKQILEEMAGMFRKIHLVLKYLSIYSKSFATL